MLISILLLCSLYLSFGQETEDIQFLGAESNEKSAKKKDKFLKVQRYAVEAWSKELTVADYDLKQWPAITKHNQPQHIFDFYAQKLSDVFLSNGGKVNFVLVGACDGTHDKTIRDRFIPNQNWNAVFVEPISYNFNDLNTFLQTNGVSNRSITIKAAVTDSCPTKTVPVKVAKYEEKDPNLPHWLRREIGSILSSAKEAEKLGKMWTVEDVPCKTASDIVKDWAVIDLKNRLGVSRTKVKEKRLPRIHVLKIDAEGHDFQVLSSFLRDEVPTEALPLLICFEAKSMHENLPRAREIMAARGYVVSEGATNDGFALLKLDVASDTDGEAAGGGEGRGDRSGRDEAGSRRKGRKGKGKKGRKAAE